MIKRKYLKPNKSSLNPLATNGNTNNKSKLFKLFIQNLNANTITAIQTCF